MALKLKKWDGAAHLHTREDMARYCAACIEEAPDDIGFIVQSLRLLGRAKAMAELEKESGLSREELSGDAPLVLTP